MKTQWDRWLECAVGVIVFLGCSVSAMSSTALCVSVPQNETPFIPLAPDGGALWPDILSTHLALHPELNRLYTIAEAADGKRLIHRDAVTGAVIASSTLAGDPAWKPLDIKVWEEGEEVLAAWGESGGGERAVPHALERVEVRTGFTKGATDIVQFIRFDIDQNAGVAWGVAEASGSNLYHLTSLDLSSGIPSATALGISVQEAILRDVIVDATRGVLYALYQPAQAGNPNLVEYGGFLAVNELPSGRERGRLALSTGNYRAGGMALDAARGAIYTAPFDGGEIRGIDAAGLLISATWTEPEIAPGFLAAGSVAVDARTGFVALANDNETQISRRVVVFDPARSAMIESWTSGADPSRLLYNPGLGWFYAASQPSQSVTAIDPARTAPLFQAPMAVLPHDLDYDHVNRRLLLLSEGGEIYSIDPAGGRLEEKLDSTGLRPAARLELDPPRNHLIAGTFGQAPPAIYDGASLSRIGQLMDSGSALAVVPEQSLFLQTGNSFLPAGSVRLLSATDGRLIHETPSGARFAQTLALSADGARNLLYGITGTRPAGLGRGVWHYNWVTHASGELSVPPPAGGGGWNPIVQIAADHVTGKIAVVAVANGNATHLLLYDNPADASPVVLALPELTAASDLLIDPTGGLAVVLGNNAITRRAWLYWVNVQGAPAPGSRMLDLPAPAQRMALEGPRGVLWLATAAPSGVHGLSWPVNKAIPKPAEPRMVIDLIAEARPGYNSLRWSTDHAGPAPPASLFRQDGELAAFRPLLPAALPGSATEYADTDIVAGGNYRYRVVIDSAAAETGEVAAMPAAASDFRVRPLVWLSRVPAGEARTVTFSCEGGHLLDQSAPIQIANEVELNNLGIQAQLPVPTAAVPGVFNVNIRAATGSGPGIHAVAVDVAAGTVTRRVWTFVEITAPFAGIGAESMEVPARSRQPGIHTDSVLREDADNLLVIKGDLNALAGSQGGTDVIVRIDPGDGRIIERRDAIASGGRYAFSVRLPQLTAGTLVRARVTWEGAASSPGGVSPLLRLPVGAYSLNASSKALLNASPLAEAALFIRGRTPAGLDPPPADGDMDAIVSSAEDTLLIDFNNDARQPYLAKSDIEQAVPTLAGSSVGVIYAAADTADGTLRLTDGDSFTPQELAALLAGLNPQAPVALIVEGPQSGRFADAAAAYPPGTTVITSSSAKDKNNRLSPSALSFSSIFFEQCRKGKTLAESVDSAALAFLDRFAGASQTPRLVSGSLAETQLARRFLPAEIPDLQGPEILGAEILSASTPNGAMGIVVKVRDNRDRPEQMTVSVRSFDIEGQDLGKLTLTPPQTADDAHEGILGAVPAPGVGIVIIARDRAGNESDPLNLWTLSPGIRSVFDMDGNNTVDAQDLLRLIKLDESGRLSDAWMFGFQSEWMEGGAR